MAFTMGFMQKIILHNNTKHEITNMVLKHTGSGGSSSKIKSLKAFKEDTVNLYTLRLIKNHDLILSCEWNGKNIESVIYDKLSSNDLRVISVFLTEKDNDLKWDILVGNDVER